MSAFRQSIVRVPEWYNEHNQEPDGSRSLIAELNHRLADCDRADCPRRFADGRLGRSFLTAIEYGLGRDRAGWIKWLVTQGSR